MGHVFQKKLITVKGLVLYSWFSYEALMGRSKTDNYKCTIHVIGWLKISSTLGELDQWKLPFWTRKGPFHFLSVPHLWKVPLVKTVFPDGCVTDYRGDGQKMEWPNDPQTTQGGKPSQNFLILSHPSIQHSWLLFVMCRRFRAHSLVKIKSAFLSW